MTPTTKRPDIEDLAWRRVGTAVHKRPCYELGCFHRIAQTVFPTMSQTLGRVIEKNDGRWEWFQFGHSDNPLWIERGSKQGVAATMQEAIAAVEEGLKCL